MAVLTVNRTPPASEAVEREEVFELLSGFADAARNGHGKLVALSGEPGVGKSTVLDGLAATAAADGFRVLAARGDELDASYPLRAVVELFQPQLSGLDRASRERLLSGSAQLAGSVLGLGTDAAASVPSAAASPQGWFPFVQALYWLTYNLADEQPTTILLDDAHWVDAASLRFLDYLVRRLDQMPALVVVAVRESPTTDRSLSGLLSVAEDVRVECLSEHGVAKVLDAAFARRCTAHFASACHGATKGNPLLLEELVGELIRAGVDPVDESVARVHDVGSDSVAEAVWARVNDSAPEVAALAKAASACGISADFAVASEIARLEPVVAAQALEQLIEQHVLEADRPLRFHHPLVRQSIYRHMTDEERARTHARAVAVLRSRFADTAALIPHLLASEPAGDVGVVDALVRAAKGALRAGEPAAAQRYLSRALEEPPPLADRAEVLASLAESELLTNDDPRRALEHIAESVGLSRSGEARARRVLMLARVHRSLGNVDRAVEVLSQEAAAGDEGGSEAHVRLLAELDSLTLMLPDHVDEASARVKEASERAPTQPGERLVIANVAIDRWRDGTARAASRAAVMALADGRLIVDEGPEALVCYQLVWVLAYADEFELADEAIATIKSEAWDRGSMFGHSASLLMSALVGWRTGDLARVERDSRSVLEFDTGLSSFSAGLAVTYLSLALIERGELDEADRLLEESCGPHVPALPFTNPAFLARARLRATQERVEEALDDLFELGRRNELLQSENPVDAWRCLAAELRLAQGRERDAIELAETHLEHAKRWGTESAVGVARRTVGLCRGADGIEDLRAAVVLLDGSGARLEHARSLVELGSAIRRAGDRRGAREPLRDALSVAQPTGATGLIERARKELVASGAKPRRLTFSGPGSLTASERRIAQLAAEGLSNREIADTSFITVKTVENHLNRCYQKLSISSRSELPDALGWDA